MINDDDDETLDSLKHLISYNAFTGSPIKGNYVVIENAVIGLCALIKITAPSVFYIAQI